MPALPASTPPHRPSGLPHAISAFLLWGTMPLYMHAVSYVPPLELVGWRVVFALPVCLLFVAFARQGAELVRVMRSPRVLMVLLASASLVALNWVIFTTAVLEGHVLATSLGYYMNPLVNVLLGTVFLRERLRPRQWLAVAVAVAGVSLLGWGARDTLYISLSLAFTFSIYGLVRKIAPVGSIVGLTLESAILLPPAAALLMWYAAGPSGGSWGLSTGSDLMLALSGLITAAPLVLFATAAQRMDYSSLGFVQFLSPTIVFFLSLFVFGEQLKPVQLASFCAIWLAVALYVWDLIASKRRRET